MALERDITHVIRETQERIFRVALAQGLTLKAISLDSGIPYSTLRTYAGHNGPTSEMPVSVLYRLVGVVPDELLSLILPPDRAILKVPQGIDHDELAEVARDYLACKDKAHHPASEAGREIGPGERRALDAKVVRLAVAA